MLNTDDPTSIVLVNQGCQNYTPFLSNQPMVKMTIPNQCAECGAALSGDTRCQEIFKSFLAHEYSHPEYSAIHFLTVACYMIQHGCYSDKALAWIERQLQDYLEIGLPAFQICRRAARDVAPDKRTWKVLHQPDKSLQPMIPWTMTIADVAVQYHDAQSYCKLVTQWARTTLVEIKPLLSI